MTLVPVRMSPSMVLFGLLVLGNTSVFIITESKVQVLRGYEASSVGIGYDEK